MALKSTKISDANQVHIKKLLTEIATAATNQGSIISLLLGKHLEQRQIIRKLVKNICASC